MGGGGSPEKRVNPATVRLWFGTGWSGRDARNSRRFKNSSAPKRRKAFVFVRFRHNGFVFSFCERPCGDRPRVAFSSAVRRTLGSLASVRWDWLRFAEFGCVRWILPKILRRRAIVEVPNGRNAFVFFRLSPIMGSFFRFGGKPLGRLPAAGLFCRISCAPFGPPR